MQQKVSENNLQTEQEMQFHVQCLMSMCYLYLSFLVCSNLCCNSPKVIWETLERSFISAASLWTPVCVFVCCPHPNLHVVSLHFFVLFSSFRSFLQEDLEQVPSPLHHWKKSRLSLVAFRLVDFFLKNILWGSRSAIFGPDDLHPMY